MWGPIYSLVLYLYITSSLKGRISKTIFAKKLESTIFSQNQHKIYRSCSHLQKYILQIYSFCENSQSTIYKFLRKNTIYKSTKIEEKTVDSTRNICLPAPSLYKYPWHVLVELKAGQTKPTLLYSPIGG